MWDPRCLPPYGPPLPVRNSSSFLPLYKVIFGRNIVESFVWSILTAQGRVKQRFRILQENNFLRDRCWTTDLSKMACTDWRSCYVFWFFIVKSKSTIHVGTKFLKLLPHNITIVHRLLTPDCKAGIRYCKWFHESVFSELLDPERTDYADDVWLTVVVA
jgi:hypothetical protein